MPKAHLHYFTGTGNTALAVKQLEINLRKTGYECETTRVISGVHPSKSGEVDVHLIAFPVLSWAPPVLMSRYLRKMPRSQGEKAAILAVNGGIIVNGKLVRGYTGQALEKAERILRRKGYDVFLTGNASFPDNWTQMTNPCNETDTKALIENGIKDLEGFTESLLAGKKSLYRCGAFNQAWSGLIAGLFNLIGRRFLGKMYIADEKCTGCTLCAKCCPAKTIVMERNQPRWRTNCIDCNRCINACPEKAIQFSMPLLIIQSVLNILITIILIKWALLITPTSWEGPGFLLTLADIVLVTIAIGVGVWVSLVPVDYLLRQLQRIAPVRHFFSRSHTQGFRRYLAPGFKPGKD